MQGRKNCVLVFSQPFPNTLDASGRSPGPKPKENPMTYYAINGSPRKTHNTATILNKALKA